MTCNARERGRKETNREREFGCEREGERDRDGLLRESWLIRYRTERGEGWFAASVRQACFSVSNNSLMQQWQWHNGATLVVVGQLAEEPCLTEKSCFVFPA